MHADVVSNDHSSPTGVVNLKVHVHCRTIESYKTAIIANDPSRSIIKPNVTNMSKRSCTEDDPVADTNPIVLDEVITKGTWCTVRIEKRAGRLCAVKTAIKEDWEI